MKRNIFLIGMMGSGKSTVGKLLAQRLNMKFVDIDDIVEKATDMSISEIFKKYGEEKFRDMEGTFFKEKAIHANQVFATGGGIVLDQENRQVLQNGGVTILLRANPDNLSKRIHTPASRPLLCNIDNLTERLTILWKKRKPFYESSAHVIIDTDHLTSEEVVNCIIHHLQTKNEDN